MIDQKTYEHLQEQNWKDILTKINAYSIRKSQRLHWQRGFDVMAKGNTPSDIVQKAIAQAYGIDGNRKWDYNKQPDLLKHLMNTVDSLISNLITSKEHKTTTGLSTESEIKGKTNSADNFDIQSGLSEIEDILNGDDELGVIFECLKADLKPREIATDYNIPISDVYQNIRKIKRRAKNTNLGRQYLHRRKNDE